MSRKNFSTWFNEIRKNLSILINNQKYDEALSIIDTQLQDLKGKTEKQQAHLFAELGGFLIDIAEESRDEKPEIKGLGIYKRKEDLIKQYVWHGSYHYNLGNAYDSIFKIKLFNNRIEYKPKNLWLLNQSKDSFWKAYKACYSNAKIEFQPHFLVNLGNSLDKSGRVVEALQFYDLVIKEDPMFPKAHANRAQALYWLHQISGSSSFMLFYKINLAYTIASKGTGLPEWMREDFKNRASFFEQKIRDLPGFKNFDIEDEKRKTQIEYQNHSIYRKFCLDNLLALSEHSLYCKCTGARRDDLMISTPSFPIKGEFIPIMEHYLNRIKSEFSTSRLLYYRSITGENDDWQVFQDEVTYTELFEGESVNISTEMLRTSYRLCFGILDKIGEAICELYDLAGKKENIYFESFWKQGGKNRWEKINSLNNPSLLALYSQACDLNSKKGEWAFFKQWRNSLEHGLFVITDDDYPDLDPFRIYDKKRKVVSTNYTNFKNQTLHLLRFTRSAIFNFVFCARREAGPKINDKKGPSITLNHK
jgi:hypothetical protein